MTIVWQDNVTPLDAAHLNGLEQTARKDAANGYPGLSPTLSLAVAGSVTALAGDAGLQVRIGSTGLTIGTAGDVALSRVSAGIASLHATEVRLDGTLVGRDAYLSRDLFARNGDAAMSMLGIIPAVGLPGVGFGSALDTTLYRQAAGVLKTDAALYANDLFVGGRNVFANIDSKVDTSAVVAAASRLVASRLLFADPQPAFVINGNGAIQWGPGGALGPDTTLYRSAAGQLQTDGILTVGNDLRVLVAGEAFARWTVGAAAGRLRWSDGAGVSDTFLYRSAAGSLKTDGRLVVGGTDPVSNARLSAVYDSNGIEFGHTNAAGYRSTLGGEATTGVPFLAFNAEAGTTANTYRTRGLQGVVLTSDLAGGFQFANIPAANADNQAKVNLFTVTALGAGTFSSRVQANSAAAATAQVLLGQYGGSVPFAGMTFGGDTFLWRSAVGALRTDGSMQAMGAMYVDLGGTAAPLYFGGAADVSLYRYGAGTLATTAQFVFTHPTLGLRLIEVGAPDTGGAGYRMLRCNN